VFKRALGRMFHSIWPSVVQVEAARTEETFREPRERLISFRALPMFFSIEGKRRSPFATPQSAPCARLCYLLWEQRRLPLKLQ